MRPPPFGRIPADGLVARAAHVFVLSALAVAQPLWSLLAGNAEFYVARNADRAEIVSVALLLLLVPPLVVLAVEQLAALAGARLLRAAHLLAVGGFSALILAALLTRLLERPGWLVLGLTALGGLAMAAYYATTAGARRLLTVLGPLPVVLLAVFLLGRDVRPLVLPAGSAAALDVSVARPAPVVFLVFDEFPGTSYLTRELEIDAERAPNLAAFARTATWYRNASTVGEVSEMAVPAILTGRRVTVRKPPTAANYPVNLFSIFAAGGYAVEADETVTRICTSRTCGKQPPRAPLASRVKGELSDLAVVYGHTVLPRDLARRLPEIGLSWGNFRERDAGPAGPAGSVGSGGVRTDIDARQQPRFDRFLDGLARHTEPVLHYFHALTPHAPFDSLPNGKQYADGRSFIGLDFTTGIWPSDPFFADQAQQRNLLQVGYADWQFGRIVDRLKRLGMFDESLIVLVGDHGSANRPGVNRRAFAETTLGDVGSVPLFVKLPGQSSGRVEDRSAETVDVLPTVAAVLGMRLPGPVDGHDLTDPAWRPTRKLLVNKSGREFVVPADFPQRRESVERIYSLFAHRGDSLDLFALGPYRALVGRSWKSLPARQVTGLTAKLAHPEFWTGPPPAGGISPAHMTGRLGGVAAGGRAGAPVDLLVAVGDRIVATSRTFSDSRHPAGSLSILVPDEALAPGHAPVRLFAVTGGPDAPLLSEVAYR